MTEMIRTVMYTVLYYLHYIVLSTVARTALL